MNRPFTPADSGKSFLFTNPDSHYSGRIGQLETFPLVDPGSAEDDEGILWFGPVDDREGWDYARPSDVEEAPEP